ncbi:MAG TPA: glycosyltransferase [Candidatus Baltobacteraceae bacterium]|jgi:glycosyltransferase involved in cell wall biosynthesis|nr:glycosyltransferase [Candidatus Baltobacteraceae bacterium]
MSGEAKRLVVVTSRFPFGTQEGYLGTELAELTKHFQQIAVVPVRPPAGPARHPVPPGVEVLAWPLVDLTLLARAVRALRHPAALRAVAAVFLSRDRGRLKNASVIVKALALADWAAESRFNHIHAYWISTPATVAMIAGEATNIPWSATAHRWDIYERNAFDVKERSVAFVRAISARGASDLKKRMPRLDGRVMELRLGTVVPPAVNERPRPAGEFRIACPAALVPVKGHDVLLAAVSVLRSRGIPVRCTLCGAGPLHDRLRETARTLGIAGAVDFAGFVPQERLHEWYRDRHFSAIVLASRCNGETMMEGVPSALLEAMAFGVPVVATDSGSVGELVDDGCGRLVRADDAAALAAALEEVYKNPDAAFARARRARQRIRSDYDVRTQMRELASAVKGGTKT